MDDITRRDLLGAGAVGVGIATAGCTGSLLGDGGDDSDDGTEDGENADTGGNGENATSDESADGGEQNDEGADDETVSTALPGLNQVQIENHHAESHTAHVLVENGGEIVHWSSHDVEAKENVRLDRTWSDERGAFVVSFRIDDQDEWTQIDLTEERPNCYDVAPRITDDGSVKIWWMRNPEGCGAAPGGE